MKVMQECRWERYIDCCCCKSWLRLDADDLRMTADKLVYVTCPVCNAKNEIKDAPAYVVRQLKELLSAKIKVDKPPEIC